MPAASGLKVEIEWVAGTWTDVSTDVDLSYGFELHVGRTSLLGKVQPSTFVFTLINLDARYTPKRQLLADGVTTAPYYPNVTVSKRVRFSNSSGVRYIGEIDSFVPVIVDGKPIAMQISCVDQMARLARVKMPAPLAYEILADGPLHYWPMTDDGSLGVCLDEGTAASRATALAPNLPGLNSGQTSFGADGPPCGDGSALGTVWPGTGPGAFMSANQLAIPTVGGFLIEIWVKFTLPLPAWTQEIFTFSVYDPLTVSSLAATALVDATGIVTITGGTVPVVGTGKPIADGNWHQVILYVNNNGFETLIIDGHQVTITGGTNVPVGSTIILSKLSVGGTLAGSLAHCAVYVPFNTPGRNLAHWNAGNGWQGETVDARINRMLTYAGVDPADMDLAGSTVTLNSYLQTDVDVVTGCQDAAGSESNDAVFYFRNGLATFRGKAFRSATVALTIDSAADTDGRNYQPREDRTSLANRATVSQADVTGALSTSTANDLDSQAQHGIFDTQSQTTTTYSQQVGAELFLAEDQVARNSDPTVRLPQLAIDLMTSQNNLQAAVQAVEIGSRVQETTLPATISARTTRDSYLEGWTETGGTDSYAIVFDTSLADSPAPFILDDPVYGRLQCDGQTTAGARSAAQTTMTTTTAAGDPLFTTDPTQYPMYEQVGEEIIQLTQAPTGTAPQSFANSLRGQKGSTAAAMVAGQSIDIFPASTLAL